MERNSFEVVQAHGVTAAMGPKVNLGLMRLDGSLHARAFALSLASPSCIGVVFSFAWAPGDGAIKVTRRRLSIKVPRLEQHQHHQLTVMLGPPKSPEFIPDVMHYSAFLASLPRRLEFPSDTPQGGGGSGTGRRDDLAAWGIFLLDTYIIAHPLFFSGASVW